MRKIIFFVVLSFLISCNSTRSHYITAFDYSECKECNVNITFYKVDNNIKSVSFLLNKKINIKNHSFKLIDVEFYYFKKDEKEPDNYVWLSKKHEKLIEKSGKLNKISLLPLQKKDIFYHKYIYIDNLNCIKNLEHYKNLVKPTDMSSVMSNSPNSIDKNILSYEEPFSEFKRKNPELLEFLTKGDSIELEVISPVKQKYKFKAQW